MNYLATIAKAIFLVTDAKSMGDSWQPEDEPLYLAYALLCLAKGEATTSKDVHDAWSLWATKADPESWSLVPFDKLPLSMQSIDDKYRDAIRLIAGEIPA